MAHSDYGTLSRGTPDSLQGYIEDDYDCCTLVSAGTETNENEVDHLKEEIKKLKTIIGELIETNTDICHEKATLYKKIKELETSRNCTTPSHESKQLNQLEVTLEQIKLINEYNLSENTRLMNKNLELARTLIEHQSKTPQVVIKYIEKEPKPKWAVEFDDVEDELTEQERKFVLNTIPSKKTREFLTKAVHRRRNGDFMSWGEKMGRTQRYIKKLQSHYDKELDTANATLLKLESQLQEREETISTLYQELEYEKYCNDENMEFYQQQIEDVKKMMETKEKELKQMSLDMGKFKKLYHKLQDRKESQNSSPDPTVCASNCKNTIEELQKTIEERNVSLLTSHENFHNAVRKNKELKLENNQLIQEYEKELESYKNRLQELEEEFTSSSETEDDTDSQMDEDLDMEDESHGYTKETCVLDDVEKTTEIKKKKYHKESRDIPKWELGAMSLVQKEDLDEKEEFHKYTEETEAEKRERLYLLKCEEHHKRMKERKIKKESKETSVWSLGTMFTVEEDDSVLEDKSTDDIIKEPINGRPRKKGQCEIEYFLESFLLIQNEEGRLFYYHNTSRKIKWSKTPFSSATEYKIIKDKKGNSYRGYYEFETPKLF